MNTQNEIILTGSSNTIANAMTALQLTMMTTKARTQWEGFSEDLKVLLKKAAFRINLAVAKRYMLTDLDLLEYTRMCTGLESVCANELGFAYCKSIHDLWAEGFSEGPLGDLEKVIRREYLEHADQTWVALVGNHDSLPKAAATDKPVWIPAA